MIKNKFEKACKEWLKGCSCSTDEEPELCEDCTEAFLVHIKNIKKQDEIDDNQI